MQSSFPLKLMFRSPSTVLSACIGLLSEWLAIRQSSNEIFLYRKMTLFSDGVDMKPISSTSVVFNSEKFFYYREEVFLLLSAFECRGKARVKVMGIIIARMMSRTDSLLVKEIKKQTNKIIFMTIMSN